MKCNKCNFEIKEGSAFCSNCGAKIEKNKNKDNSVVKVILIIVVIIVVLISFTTLGYILVNKFTNNTDNNKKKVVEEKTHAKKIKLSYLDGKEYYVVDNIDTDKLNIKYEDDLSKNIKIEKMYYKEDHIYILAKNENDIAIDPVIYLNFLDDTNTRVDRALADSLYVDRGKYFVTSIWVKSEEDFSSYNMTISSRKLKSYQHVFGIDSSKLSVSENNDSISVVYNNNSDKDVQVFLTILYYKNNEIYHFDDKVLFADANMTGDVDFSFYKLPNYTYEKPKDFDKFEILVTSGYYYDTSY